MMETPTVATYEAFKKEYGQSYALKAGSVLLVYKCVMDPGAFFKGMCVREGFVIWGHREGTVLGCWCCDTASYLDGEKRRYIRHYFPLIHSGSLLCLQ